MNKPNYLTFTATVTASSQDSRTITGQIVPFGKPGNTSMGPVIFELGSLPTINPESVKLLLQHDDTRPIGRMTSYEVTPGGINATFKVADTGAGTDSLIEASAGLRDGLSVGASIIDSEYIGDTLHVLQASLVEVSLVTSPAFTEARVTKVAASADTETTTQEEVITMSETTPDAPSVEVSADLTASSALTAGTPVFTAPRTPIVSAGSYLEHTIKASQGNEDSRQYVRFADDTTSTNTGLTLAPHLNEFISNTFDGGRPAVDAVSREALVDSGLSFTIPRVTATPSVAVVAENAALTEVGMTSDALTVTISKYAGRNQVSFELLDRSSPSFYTELLRQLQLQYASATDKAVLSALASSGTAATVTAATSAGLQSFMATESAAALKGSGSYARNLIANTDQWAAIVGFADTTGRPLYSAYNPNNMPGVVTGQSITGQILGANLYVDPNSTVSGLIDDSLTLVVPEAVTFYESPQTQLQVTNTANGKIEVALYGYAAVAVKRPLGVRRFNVA